MAFIFLVFALLLAFVNCELQIIKNFVPEDCSRTTKNGNKLFMHYTGSIDESSETGTKGTVFDSSHKRNRAFDFVLGAGRVIKGWDQGLLDMCVGEKRTLIIPPELGYGAQGAGGQIPGGATLRFEVECLEFGDEGMPNPEGTGHEPNLFTDIDTDKNGLIEFEEFRHWVATTSGRTVDDAELERMRKFWEMEDKNSDNVISWEEFGGPKGTEPIHPTHEEL